MSSSKISCHSLQDQDTDLSVPSVTVTGDTLRPHPQFTNHPAPSRERLLTSAIPYDWKGVTLAEIVRSDKPIVYGIVQAGPEHPNGVPYIKSADVGAQINVGNLSRTAPEIAARYVRSIVQPGDIVFSLRGNIGELSIVPSELKVANLTQGTARISVKENALGEFVAFALRSPMLQQRIATVAKGSTFKEISLEELRKLEIPMPPLAEQRKIASILGTWDEAMEKLDTVITLLAQERAAIYQNVFETDYGSGGRLLRAREVFLPVSERARPDLPLLAVMQDIGIVRRDELERRVAMPDGDTSTYKVTRPGDFVISLRSFEGGLEYSNVLGLVSPAYTVLRSSRSICAGYYRHFFKSRSFVGRLDKMIFGIRDGKQIAFRDFGDMWIPYPRIEDQERHEKILHAVSTMIDISQRKKEAFELQKRGLMQKLLTGEWRVPC